MRRAIIVGAQKLYLGLKGAVEFAQELKAAAGSKSYPFDVVVCPSFINLAHVAEVLRNSPIKVGAQNVHQEDSGAFTGQVSIKELTDQYVSYVIIGHSELRRQQGETNEMVRKKMITCLKHGVTPIVCVGDTVEDKQAGRSMKAVVEDLNEIFKQPISHAISSIVIAYEPVWAIKAGRDDKNTISATPEDAARMHAMIRSTMAKMYEPSIADAIRVVYGGSVNQNNTDKLMAQQDIDGLLVGTASIDLKSFCNILDCAEKVVKTKSLASVQTVQ